MTELQLTPAIQTLSQTLRQLFAKKNISALDTYEINPIETPMISYHFNISDNSATQDDWIMISKKEKKESGEMSELGFIKTVVSDGVAKVYFNTEDELLIKESTTESTDQTYLGATINKINGFTSFIQSQLDIIIKAEQETALAAQQAAEAKHQAELQHITEVTTQIQNF